MDLTKGQVLSVLGYLDLGTAGPVTAHTEHSVTGYPLNCTAQGVVNIYLGSGLALNCIMLLAFKKGTCVTVTT